LLLYFNPHVKIVDDKKCLRKISHNNKTNVEILIIVPTDPMVSEKKMKADGDRRKVMTKLTPA
jgi:hypothetical protein